MNATNQPTAPQQYIFDDRLVRLIAIPVVSIVFGFIYRYKILIQFDDLFFFNLLCPFVATYTLWEGTRIILVQMRKRYPRYDQTANRLIVQTSLSIVYTFFNTLFIHLLFTYVIYDPHCGDYPFLKYFISGLLPTLFITSLYESAYFFAEWKRNIQKTEALARENIQSQLEVLKSQLDPHFLFNSLNTLAALIDESNEPAQKYLEQLSDVYRYVLLNKDKATVTLQEELAFVESYLYLNKTRFRENLRVESLVPETHRQQLIAPLSLQMLVENAIKHNVISKDRPLTIRIYQESDEWITVENNVQGKNVLEKSTKVGLQNIVNRYSYLTAQPVEIQHGLSSFTVKIPLLSV